MVDSLNIPRKSFALSTLLIVSQVAPGAVFIFRTDTAGDENTVPGSDGQTFQQQWGTPNNWTLQSGVDDGANGYPDASDSIIVDRTGAVNNGTRLTTESSPGSLVAISSIVGTGTGNHCRSGRTRTVKSCSGSTFSLGTCPSQALRFKASTFQIVCPSKFNCLSDSPRQAIRKPGPKSGYHPKPPQRS